MTDHTDEERRRAREIADELAAAGRDPDRLADALEDALRRWPLPADRARFAAAVHDGDGGGA